MESDDEEQDDVVIEEIGNGESDDESDGESDSHRSGDGESDGDSNSGLVVEQPSDDVSIHEILHTTRSGRTCRTWKGRAMTY